MVKKICLLKSKMKVYTRNTIKFGHCDIVHKISWSIIDDKYIKTKVKTYNSLINAFFFQTMKFQKKISLYLHSLYKY